MTGRAADNGSGMAAELDRLRRRAGLSFRDLSKLTGHPVSTLHNALTGRVHPRLETVLSIVRACGEQEAPWRERWAGPGGAQAPVVPRELPRAPRAFVGREHEMARLCELVAAQPERGLGIVAVHGMPGVGKTAFAVRVAHLLADRFPDGQLYVDLRGHRAGAEPMPAAEALPTLLRSLGVAAQTIPGTVDGQIRLYRTVLSQRRVLVLLDDALDAEQVRSLVPSGAGCLLIVTSRHRFDGILALDGAHAVHLDVLSETESCALLENLLGAADAAHLDLAKLCGHLPLALRVAAANLAIHPHEGLADTVAELAEGRMEALRMPADGEVAVHAAFARSYRRLSKRSSKLLRRMGFVPWGQFTVDVAAVLLGAPAAQAQEALDEAEAAGLIEKRAGRRYDMHDLVRVYAGERAREEEGESGLDEVFDQLLAWCQRMVDTAARLLYPETLRLPGAESGGGHPEFGDKTQALQWLDAELANLVAVMTHASRHRPRPGAWILADSLRGYFVLRFRLQEWISVAQAGLRVAQLHGNSLAQAAMRHSLGVALSRRGDTADAERHLAQALALYRTTAWAEGSIAVLICLGGSYFHEGRLDEASEALEEALSLSARHHLPAREAAALGDLGEVYRDRGLLHRARDHQAHTARRCQELGMARGHAIALLCLGLVCVELGDLLAAHTHLTEAHSRAIALGSRDGEAYAVLGLGAVDLESGRAQQALARAEQARAMAESIAEETLVMEAGLLRAEALCHLERPEAALAEAQRVSGLAIEKGYMRGIGRSLVALARAQLALRRLEEARNTCLGALDLSNLRGYVVTAGQALTLLATLDHEMGVRESAAQHARQALDIHRRTGHRLGEAKTLRLMEKIGVTPA